MSSANLLENTIDIPEILIANGIGLTILFVVAVGNIWRLKDNSKENIFLLIAFFSCLINCIVDPVCFLADGKAGVFNRILVVGCNTILYVAGMVCAVAWVHIVASHIGLKISKTHNAILQVVFLMIILLMIVNLFVPIMFIVDENNVYERRFGFYIHMVSYIGTILDGLVLYLFEKHKSGGLKFFPVWAFVIPAFIGIVIQTEFYGLSTATPFVTVSLVCVIVCLQNEFTVRDKLTGLYNRFFLNIIEQKLLKSGKREYTAIMLDINGFKKINDTYGHQVGDEALILLASVLKDTVGMLGEVVRYAGDEFIIILNTSEDSKTEEILANINSLLDSINDGEGVPYELSVATGYCRLNKDVKSMDEFIDTIDKLMYENKQAHYKLNGGK